MVILIKWAKTVKKFLKSSLKKGKEKFSYFEPEYDMNYYRKTMFKHGDFTND